jgi:hypothetical protein
MGRNMASWKLLEDMMLELKKMGVIIPAKTVEDLRSAKSLIKLSCMPNSGDAIQKAEEYLANVEAFVITQGQKTFGEAEVNLWLKQLEEANIEVCAEVVPIEEKFILGMPRDQTWVRIEPTGDLTAEKIKQLTKEHNLEIKPEQNGKLVVFGSLENLKVFLKKLAAEKLKP